MVFPLFRMVYKCLLTFAIVFYNILFSYGTCHYDVTDARCEIPTECNSSDCFEEFAIPTNHICSISYLLFTENNKNSPCYVEPENQEFNHCEFDPSIETIILIHGFTVKLKPGNIFELIKNSLLSIDNFNVIIVNWTRYDDGMYNKTVENAYLVGIEVGKFINFLVNEKGVNPVMVYIIAHSLGAHVAGVAGKHVHNLGRITGLDPAAPSYSIDVTYNRLTAFDADFVDVIHCSNGVIANGSKGYGIPYPIGDINFYPNDGVYQPSCKMGRIYKNSDGEISNITQNQDLISCRHDICPIYFLYSIQDCEFISRECDSYKRYNMGKCFSKAHSTDSMGLYAEQLPGLPNRSKFYLKTTAYPPYCLKKYD